jgi:hypothetical protein
MSDLSITIEQNKPNIVEISLPDVSRVVTALNTVQSVTVADKYSIAGLSFLSDKSFAFNQMTPEDVWIINHNMSKFPSVSVVDSSERIVVGEVEYINQNLLKVTFNGSFAGKAYLN